MLQTYKNRNKMINGNGQPFPNKKPHKISIKSSIFHYLSLIPQQYSHKIGKLSDSSAFYHNKTFPSIKRVRQKGRF